MMMTVCGMHNCPVVTAGNYCSRHAGLTLEQDRNEQAELNRRSARFQELLGRARHLARNGAPEDGVDDAHAQAEQARRYLAELFGDPIEAVEGP